jgi:hypothetical protein
MDILEFLSYQFHPVPWNFIEKDTACLKITEKASFKFVKINK